MLKKLIFFIAIVFDATFQIAIKNLIQYLHMRIITIRYIVSCVHNAQKIYPVHIYWIYICLKDMIHFLLYNLNVSQW